jgi:tetratricopeptide (TPR) repeat protein
VTATTPESDWRARVYAWGAARRGPVTRRLVLRAARRPDRLERLAKLRAQAGDIEGAAEALEAAIVQEPTTPTWYLKLGRLYERLGPPRVQRARVGLVLRPGDREQAAYAYRRGTLACPQDAELWYRLGRAELYLGRAEKARQAFGRAVDLDPAQARHHAQLGRAIHADYTERGGTLAGEVDQELAAYRQALELDPGRDNARERLLDTTVRQRRWPEALDAANPPPAVEVRRRWDTLLRHLGDVERAVVGEVLHDHLGDHEGWVGAPVPTGWWYALHARLIDLDQYVHAYRAKAAFAGAILREPDDDPEAAADVIERARAYGSLDELDAARRELDLDRAVAHDVDPELAHKLRADLALLQGDASELLDLHHLFGAANHPAAEARFTDLLSGRDVVIVGPSEPVEDLGATIDAADTVIRPKLLANGAAPKDAAVGTRTDIAYYGTLTSGLVFREIEQLLEAGKLQMAVFRASRFRDDRSWVRHPGDLRYMPAEFGAMLRAVPFGIQRILYDVLRYRPASLRVFHADLFTGPKLHRAGYSADRQLLDERGLAPIPLSILAHDYRADFALTKALHAAGHVRARPNLEEILRLTPDAYLEVLDRRQDEAA